MEDLLLIDVHQHPMVLAADASEMPAYFRGNAYAWRSVRRVEVAAHVHTMYAVAEMAHEGGHVLGRDDASKVGRELRAWDWARATMLDWTEECHECQRSGLLSYRPQATDTECVEIDRVVSRAGFQRARCARVDASLREQQKKWGTR